MALSKEEQRRLLKALAKKDKQKGRSGKSAQKKTSTPQVRSESDLEKLLREGKITERQYRLRKTARAEVDRTNKNSKDRKKKQESFNSSTEKQKAQEKSTVSAVENEELKKKYRARDGREQKGAAKKTQLSKMLRRKKLTASQYKLKMDETRKRLKAAKATRRSFL
jgi:hypothetical protein